MANRLRFLPLLLLIQFPALLPSRQAYAFSFVERKWKFLLPRDVIEELYGIESNPSLGSMEIERLVDQVLAQQPKCVLDQLELPPFYSQLPFNAKWQIKDVVFDKSLSYRQKQEAIMNVIATLPQSLKRFPPSRGTLLVPKASGAFRAGGQLGPNGFSPLGGGDDGGGTGMREVREHSRLFDSFNALQYSVSFTFKLKELRDVLSRGDFEALYLALANDELAIDKKLAAVERVMADQSMDVLDQLFFVGVPIVDAEARERFRRLWYDRPYWSYYYDGGGNGAFTGAGGGAGTLRSAPTIPGGGMDGGDGAGGGTLPAEMTSGRLCLDCMAQMAGMGGSQPAGIFPSLLPPTPSSPSASTGMMVGLGQPSIDQQALMTGAGVGASAPFPSPFRLPSMIPDNTAPSFLQHSMIGARANAATATFNSRSPSRIQSSSSLPIYRPPTFINEPPPETTTMKPSYPVESEEEFVSDDKRQRPNEDIGVPSEVTAAALALLLSREGGPAALKSSHRGGGEDESSSGVDKWPMSSALGGADEQGEGKRRKTGGKVHYKHINELLRLLKTEVGLAKIEPSAAPEEGRKKRRALQSTPPSDPL